MAFEHKRLIPKVAKQKFKNERNKTFFRAITNVEKAKGFDVNKMIAVSGLNPNALNGKSKKVIDNLESQESGGTVKSRKLLTHSDSRTSMSAKNKVKTVARFEKNEIHDSTEAFRYQMNKTKSRKSSFISAVYSAKKAGQKTFKIKGGRKGKITGMVYQIMSINKKRVKVRKLYTYSTKTEFTVKANNFIRDSRRLAIKKTEKFYQNNAEFQFKKYLK